jgi:hypothetical protein
MDFMRNVVGELTVLPYELFIGCVVSVATFFAVYLIFCSQKWFCALHSYDLEPFS